MRISFQILFLCLASAVFGATPSFDSFDQGDFNTNGLRIKLRSRGVDVAPGDNITIVTNSEGNLKIISTSTTAITGAVASVQGKAGVVTLTTSDIPEGTNFYWTTARINAATAGLVTQTVTNGLQGALGFTPQIASVNLSNWSALATSTKQDILGFIPIPNTRSVSTTSPLGGGGALSADITLTIQTANGSQAGALASSDWTIFNGKQNGSANLTNWAQIATNAIPAAQLTGTVDNARLPDPMTVSTVNATTLTLSNPLRGDQVQFSPGANITLTTNGSGGVSIAGSAGGGGSSTNGNFTNAVFWSTGPPAVTITGGTSNYLGGVNVMTNLLNPFLTGIITLRSPGLSDSIMTNSGGAVYFLSSPTVPQTIVAKFSGDGSLITGLPYRAGTTNIGNLATTLLVTFTSPLSSANYAVGITFDTTLGAAVSAAATSKTANGFTISLSAGIAGGANLDYTAWPYQ